MSIIYLWLFAYGDYRDFFGDEDLQRIGALRTPSNIAYGEAFLNMPLEDGTIADFVTSSPVEDYAKLNSHMDYLFKDTDFEWYLAIYSGRDDTEPTVVFNRDNWRFSNGFNGYEDYLLPVYPEGVMKVTLAVDKGIWVPGEKAEEEYYSAPGRAIGRVV